MSEWYVRAFDAAYLECYQMFEAEPVWMADCDFIVDRLELAPGDAVLDLCCGSGRHSVELASRGIQVTGLDASPSMIEYARNRAAEHGVEVEWIQADACQMDFDQCFDGVFNYLTSFGLCGQEGDLKMLQGAFRALKPGGRLLIEMINMIWLMGNFVPTERRVCPDFTYVERRRFDPRTGIIHTQREKRAAGQEPEPLESFHVRAHMPCDVVRLLERAGFEVGGFTASPTGQPFQTFSTPRMAIIAAKPA